jgi:hypothetical protein
VSERKGGEFHREEDDPGILFHDEVEPIDPWDDILHDGRIHFRTLHDAWEEFRANNEERYDT